MTDNNVAVFGGSVPMKGASALASALKESAGKNPRSGGADGSDFLNFSGKAGRYNPDLPSDELFIPNISGFEDGWICWKGGKPAATRMANILEEPVPTPDMGEFGPFGESEGWFQCKAMTLKSLDTDKQYYFKINSISGVSAIADFVGEIAERAGNGAPAWPVISLSSESFTSGGYQNYKPVFKVDGWLSDDIVSQAFSDAPLKDLYALSTLDGGGASPAEGNEEAPVSGKRLRRI